MKLNSSSGKSTVRAIFLSEGFLKGELRRLRFRVVGEGEGVVGSVESTKTPPSAPVRDDLVPSEYRRLLWTDSAVISEALKVELFFDLPVLALVALSGLSMGFLELLGFSSLLFRSPDSS